MRGDEVVEEGGAEGHDDHEDHGRAVHGEQLIEGLGIDEVAVRLGHWARMRSASMPPIMKKMKAVVP